MNSQTKYMSTRQGLAYEWEVLWIHGTSLYQELIPPAIERFETLGVVDIVDQYAAVCSAIERNA
jgi:hypothetical protein